MLALCPCPIYSRRIGEMVQYFWKPEEHTRVLGFGDYHIFMGKDTRRFRASVGWWWQSQDFGREENLGQFS